MPSILKAAGPSFVGTLLALIAVAWLTGRARTLTRGPRALLARLHAACAGGGWGSGRRPMQQKQKVRKLAVVPRRARRVVMPSEDPSPLAAGAAINPVGAPF